MAQGFGKMVWRLGMEFYTEKEDCCGCGACADVCPADAVCMTEDEEGFWYPQVDGSKCVDCGQCRQVCPVKNHSAEHRERLYFGVQAREQEKRYGSSSGGMFPILAEYMLRRGGVVYGAAFQEHMEVVHREAHNLEELETLKKTKYVQSNLKGIYRRIRTQLNGGRWVLFCGTPCQTQALRLFLRKPYEKLVTADLVCYGAPSPGIWSSYVKYLEHKHHGTMTGFSFRDKRNRDNGHARSYVINGREYAGSLYGDAYCRMYFANVIVRPSCHSCGFCTADRNSDFTLGDFWGIERMKPDMDDGMGTSMVIVHTAQAQKIWEEVKEELSWFSCTKEDVLQPRLTGPTPAAKGRGMFMALYKILPFSLFLMLFTKTMSGIALLRRIRR